MKSLQTVVLASSLLIGTSTIALAEIKVMASIKPVHSLVASIMEGAGSPSLIVQGSASPHTYSLKPSQADELQNADVVFWVGHELEAFLEKPLEIRNRDNKTCLVSQVGWAGLRLGRVDFYFEKNTKHRVNESATIKVLDYAIG